MSGFIKLIGDCRAVSKRLLFYTALIVILISQRDLSVVICETAHPSEVVIFVALGISELIGKSYE